MRLGALTAALVVPALTACQPMAPPAPEAPAAVVQQDVAADEVVAVPPAVPTPGAVPPVVPSEPVEQVSPEPSATVPGAQSPDTEVPAAGLPDPEAPGTGLPDTGAPAEAAADELTATAADVGSAAGPLAGDLLHGPNDGAAQAAARLQGSRPGEAALLADMAAVPTATWLGSWLPDVSSAVRQRIAQARAAGGVPVFVAYNVPDLDCGGHSASGGAASAAAYETWIQAVAAGIGSAEAVVIVEPDTLALLCGSADERLGLLATAVRVLEANPATHTYLDAGHSNWVDVPTTVERLRAAGVERADGFALNVSNFEPTGDNIAFGAALSAELGGAHFVVDTSRNGNGPGNDWCNPSGRALGEETTTKTGHPLVDAFIWVKTPGESDGACNGGPAAGQFWLEYALGLARQ